MTVKEKETYLPLPLKTTEQGSHIFPKSCLLSFVRKVVSEVKSEISDETFKRYGENVFKVTVACIIIIEYILKYYY